MRTLDFYFNKPVKPQKVKINQKATQQPMTEQPKYMKKESKKCTKKQSKMVKDEDSEDVRDVKVNDDDMSIEEESNNLVLTRDMLKDLRLL